MSTPPALTDELRYLLDLQGFCVVPGVLDSARVARMNATLDSPPSGLQPRWRQPGGSLADPGNNPYSRFQFLDMGCV